MTKPNETRIQGFILAQLSIEPECAVITADGKQHGDPYARAIFWRQNTGAARTADHLIRFGIPGQSDITGVIVGRRIDIECKTDTGKQSIEQREYQARITYAGGIYIVARNLGDVLGPVRRLLAGEQC